MRGRAQWSRPCALPALLLLLAAGLMPAAAHEAHGEPHAPGVAPPQPGSYALPALRKAPDGGLRDEAGKPLALRALLNGRIVVLSFIYTHCPAGAGCPLASYTLAQAAKRLRALGPLGAQVRFLSVSFDPVRDSAAVLAEYGRHFRPEGFDWRFLAADPGTLPALLEGYRQDVERDPKGGDFAHTLRVFLIDPQGRIRNEYSAGFLDAGALAADVATVALAGAGTQAAAPAPRSGDVGAGDPRQGYDEGVYASDSRALGNRDAQAADLHARLAQGERGLPRLPGALPSAVQIELGRKLFFDRRLSHNDTLSCASCHVPEQGFASNELKTPVGIEGRSVRRNAPSLLNVAFLPRLFLDARETRLEQQIWGPLLASNEMGNPSIGYLLGKLADLPDYAGRFEAAFAGAPVDMATLGAAFAAYERALIAGDSAFDRKQAGIKADRFGDAAARGLALFTGKAGCSACHLADGPAPRFTDGELHNTGVGFRQSMQPGTTGTIAVTVAPGERLPVEAGDRAAGQLAVNDLGRYEVSLDPADRWRFRTPSLRNVALTAPYLHDGSLPDLPAVMAFYNAGGIANEGLDPRIKPLGLSPTEQADLVAFLQSLTGSTVPVLVRDAWAAPIGDRQRR